MEFLDWRSRFASLCSKRGAVSLYGTGRSAATDAVPACLRVRQMTGTEAGDDAQE
jgi:hypothetical protein